MAYKIELSSVEYTPIDESEEKILCIDNLTVDSGNFVSIIGRNGSGKTTLLRTISGNLSQKQRKSLSGKIKVGGRSVDRPINRVIDRVGVVHQSPKHDLVQDLSLAQNIAIRQMFCNSHNPKIFSTPMDWESKISYQIQQATNIDTPLSTRVKHLSGGQQQLFNVLISIELEHDNNDCELLLLDEHTANLDFDNSNEVMQFTHERLKEKDATAIMATHQMEEALNYSDRILVLEDGEISHDLVNLSDRNPEDLYNKM